MKSIYSIALIELQEMNFYLTIHVNLWKQQNNTEIIIPISCALGLI